MGSQFVASVPEKPALLSGVTNYLRRHPVSSVITIALIVGLTYLALRFFDWAVLNAVWNPDRPELCGADRKGACWAVIAARWRLIMFGLYPFDEQWRSAISSAIVLATVALSCFPVMWRAKELVALWVVSFAAFNWLMSGGILGLAYVPTRMWGGLSLTLYVFAFVCIVMMPTALVLALLKRSRMPFIRLPVTWIVDFLRSLPLLVVMFFAAVVLPFGMPDWMTGEKLYRVIIAFAFYNACYQAEVLRAGIESLPKGQEEAAKALGMNYLAIYGYIILPQAFRITLPATINQIVIVFLETALIVIIGFFDILASGNAAFGTAQWGTTSTEVYLFVGAIFFVCCLSLSKYGGFLEHRLAKRHAR
jgi:general L-amino acid transport system permease protein